MCINASTGRIPHRLLHLHLLVRRRVVSKALDAMLRAATAEDNMISTVAHSDLEFQVSAQDRLHQLDPDFFKPHQVEEYMAHGADSTTVPTARLAAEPNRTAGHGRRQDQVWEAAYSLAASTLSWEIMLNKITQTIVHQLGAHHASGGPSSPTAIGARSMDIKMLRLQTEVLELP